MNTLAALSYVRTHLYMHALESIGQVETLSTRVLLFLGDDPAHTLRLFTSPAVGACLAVCFKTDVHIQTQTHTDTHTYTQPLPSLASPPSKPPSTKHHTAPRRSLVPPPFQFGPWNQFGNEFNDTGYLEAIARFKELDIPRCVWRKGRGTAERGMRDGVGEDVHLTSLGVFRMKGVGMG